MSSTLLGSLVFAQSAASDDSSGSGFNWSIVILPLMFVALYFVMIRPQQKKAKAQAAMQRQVAEGDEIITTSGMYGIVTAMDDEDIWLEISDGVEIRVARGAVLRVTQSVNSTVEAPTEED